MKQFLLFACLSIFTLGLNAQVFVDADAAGTGDGTSWADAYTNLNDALLAATAGSEVWIADGTYTTPDTVSFFIDKELTVLGGFNGTETMASEADPAANATILSGDVMGNDVAGTYDSLGYADNNRVLFITDTNAVSAYTVTLDGLTITNGGIAADEGADDPIVPFSGGGIITFAKLEASRLTFSNNRAFRGAAMALFGNAGESVLDTVSLTGNFSGVSRQIYINGPDGVTIKRSTFRENPDVQQQSGFIQAAFVQGLTVEDCTFADMNSAFSGAGVRADQSDDVVVSGCTFDNMTASTGGACYFVQGDDFVPDSGVMDGGDFVIDGCTITNCLTPANRGGGVTAFNTNIRITNSELSDNTSGNIGGGLYQVPVDARDYVMELDKTTFSGNVDAGAGGAICLLVFGNDNGNASVVGTIDGCTFSGNVSGGGQSSGGAMYLQSENNFTITNTNFTENLGGFGTILTRGVTGIDMKNCTFTENGSGTDSFQGAGVVGYFDDNSAGLIIDSCTFVEQTVTDFGNITSGGAVVYAIGGTAKTIPMEISNSMFMNNAAADGRSGGAIYLIAGFATKIDNCEFVGNTAGGDAGAINVSIGEATRDTMENGQIDITYEPWSGEITNSKFINSLSGTQGGAISTQRAGFDISNSVFVGNSIGADGFSGGAIIFNGNAPGLDANGVEVVLGDVAIASTMANNTFVDNFKGTDDAAVGDNIALFMPGDTDNGDSNSMVITLINNAFLLGSGNPSLEVELGQDEADLGFIPIGNLTVTSMGGNFFNTENGPNIPTFDDMTGDFMDENVDYESLFVDLLDDQDMGINVDLAILGDFGVDNPLINNGVAGDMTPGTDVRGNPRGEFPDIGAYEADQGLVDTDEPVENSGLALNFYPNPTIDVLNIENEDVNITKFHVMVSDQMGRVLKAAQFNGSVNRLDMSTMPSGVYNLRLFVNGKVYSKQVVKQ